MVFVENVISNVAFAQYYLDGARYTTDETADWDAARNIMRLVVESEVVGLCKKCFL